MNTLTTDTGLSLEIVISVMAGIIAWVGSYMSTKTKLSNTESVVDMLTSELSELQKKLTEMERNTSKEIRSNIDTVKTQLENKLTSTAAILENKVEHLHTEFKDEIKETKERISESSKNIYEKFEQLKIDINSLDKRTIELENNINKIRYESDANKRILYKEIELLEHRLDKIDSKVDHDSK